MVQKAIRGRPPSFDRDAVVGAAVLAFWRAGADATSVGELEAATGVDRSTLYNSFGGKRGLHRQAAATYVGWVEQSLFDPLRSGDAGIDDLVRFLDDLSGRLASPDTPSGCFVVNAMAHDDRDEAATDRYLTELHAAVRAAVARAVRGKEVDVDVADDVVRVVVAAVLGGNLLATTAGPDVAVAHLASVRRMLASRSDGREHGAAGRRTSASSTPPHDHDEQRT